MEGKNKSVAMKILVTEGRDKCPACLKALYDYRGMTEGYCKYCGQKFTRK